MFRQKILINFVHPNCLFSVSFSPVCLIPDFGWNWAWNFGHKYSFRAEWKPNEKKSERWFLLPVEKSSIHTGSYSSRQLWPYNSRGFTKLTDLRFSIFSRARGKDFLTNRTQINSELRVSYNDFKFSTSVPQLSLSRNVSDGKFVFYWTPFWCHLTKQFTLRVHITAKYRSHFRVFGWTDLVSVFSATFQYKQTNC